MRLLRQLLLPRWARSGRVVAGSMLLAGMAAVAVLAPWIAPHDPSAQDLNAVLRPLALGSAHPLGTDSLGRCVLSRMLHGTRTAWAMAAAAAASVILGGLLACVSLHFGGWIDRIAAALARALTAFPPLVLVLVGVAGTGPGIGHVALILVVATWGGPYQVLRHRLREVAERQHVAAARLLGASRWQVLWHEVLPESPPLLAALMPFGMAAAIVLETMLSFLGLGASPAEQSWGRMLADGWDVVLLAPMAMLAPGAVVVAIVAGLTLLADGLRKSLGLRLMEAWA